MVLEKISHNDYLFQCPKCGVIGHIDKDQAEGKVSIFHPEDKPKCDYHETKNWLANPTKNSIN